MFNYFSNMFNNLCIKAATTPLPINTASSPVQVPVNGAQSLPAMPSAPVPVQMPVNLPASIPAAVAAHSMNTLQYVVLFVYFAVCAALIFLVLVQTSKSEGLTGTLGGSTQSVFKGKKSFEEQMNKITTYVAVLFVALSIVIAWFVFR